MAITRVNHGTVAKVASGNLSPGAPASPVTDDLWLALIWSNSTNAVTMDAAWTQIFSVSVPTSRRFQAFWAPYSGTAPVLTVTNSGGAGAIAVVVAYRPSSGATLALDGSATQADSLGTTLNYPTVTPAQANEMCVFAWGAEDSLGPSTNGAVGGTDPVPTEWLDDTDAVHFTALGYADGIRTAATATGARTSTFSTGGEDRCGATILLKETSGAAPQQVYPTADVSAGTWTNEAGSATNLYVSIDEVGAPVDSDYIQSGERPVNDAVEILLGTPGAPSAGPGTLYIRHGRI